MGMDWESFLSVFENNTAGLAPDKPSANETDIVKYNGEKMPRRLARDLMQERAAIMEYDAGLTRVEAEAIILRGLGNKSRAQGGR
ncbi:MAG: hypothetical protein JKX71_08100 [Amylibacter sp.]|nr:hypothetical protein [Amylibacter sp.]